MEDRTIRAAVLYIDTDAVGFFRESEQDLIRFYLQKFGVRVKLELALLSFLDHPKSRSDEQQDDSHAEREKGQTSG